MFAGQAEEIIALALVFAVHVVGGVMLVWALLDGDQRGGPRRRWPRRPGGGEDPPPRSPPPSGAPRGARGPRPLPLERSRPARVRLREPLRAGDAYPRPARRPQHPEQPEPRPAPAPQRRRRA